MSKLTYNEKANYLLNSTPVWSGEGSPRRDGERSYEFSNQPHAEVRNTQTKRGILKNMLYKFICVFCMSS